MRRREKRILIKNGRVHDGLGQVLDHMDILLEEGKITAMGTGIKEEAEQIIDASGCEVLPGFVNGVGCWGGIGPGMDENHLSETADPVSPEMDVKDVFTVDGITSSELYRYGITASCLTPDFSGLFTGQAAVYKTYGFQPDQMLVRDKAAAVGALSERVKEIHAGKPAMNTSMGIFDRFLEALHRGTEAAASPSRDFKGEALSAIVNGQLPLILHLDSRTRYEFLKSELEAFPNLQCVINGIFDIACEDAQIACGRHWVILDSIADSSSQFGQEVKYDQIGHMVEQGAQIALSANFVPAEMMHREALLWNANLFYKNGVSCESVIRMITSIPAKILGVDHRIGSLEIGKDGDLSVWSANPVTTFTAGLQYVFINGEEIASKEKVRVCW